MTSQNWRERSSRPKQRIIKLKAQEMQLSAPDRVREIAKGKFGMTEADGVDEFFIK
jgi:hypothetical protein